MKIKFRYQLPTKTGYYFMAIDEEDLGKLDLVYVGRIDNKLYVYLNENVSPIEKFNYFLFSQKVKLLIKV